MKYNEYTFPREFNYSKLDEKRVFMLIDMQPEYLICVKPEKMNQMLKNQLNVLSYCSNHDIPVIVLEYEEKGKTLETLTDIIRYIPRHSFLTKDMNNGFTNPNLIKQLKRWNVEEVYLMGVNASLCVKQTAEGVLENGFSIATAEKVIGNMGNFFSDLSKDWYNSNGIYLED